MQRVLIIGWHTHVDVQSVDHWLAYTCWCAESVDHWLTCTCWCIESVDHGLTCACWCIESVDHWLTPVDVQGSHPAEGQVSFDGMLSVSRMALRNRNALRYSWSVTTHRLKGELWGSVPHRYKYILKNSNDTGINRTSQSAWRMFCMDSSKF